MVYYTKEVDMIYPKTMLIYNKCTKSDHVRQL